MKIDQDHFYTSIANYYDQIFPLNSKQVTFVESSLQSLSGKNILDVGCSTGKLANELASLGCDVTGIDLNSDMIQLAKEAYPSTNLHFRETNMLDLDNDFPGKLFHGIVCFGNTLVHLSSLGEIGNFFNTARKHLVPGGKLMVQVLNYDYILENEITDLPLIDTENIGFIRKYDLPTKPSGKIIFNTELIIKETRDSHFHASYLIPLRKNEIETLLEINGFSRVKFYSNFDKRPYGGHHLPLVFIAEKTSS
ncbi:class I SAM-dependent methyltransferase [Sunxiuqinia sp. A32]|uniref:class I SAM-dependent methyltransferase n=1 Tax=Sunxiuqinia sp. A32 TaxID=3461496 RepID=UPI0040453FDD